MEALSRMNDSIDYLEKRLDSVISMEEAAAAACMSKFHFHRMFQMVTGVTPGEYVRKRRLTLAAQELTHSQAKVINIALKYGYETPESFSKAFRKAHGMSPTEARQTGRILKAYPRLSFQIQLKGEKEMNYHIVDKESFKVVGKSIKASMVNGEQHGAISQFWEESNQINGLSERLAPLTGPMGFLGICLDFDQEKEEMRYMIGAENPSHAEAEDLEVRTIPSLTWAVFESIGPMPGAIQEVWSRIYTEWFPSTGYEHAAGPEMEVYPKDGNPFAADYRSEVWVPIIKK
ncbi:AraC family transcriptional regulator [Metabacillus sp. FJAT-52054]|uniref:AraC family transcriptional regulator n=1 Tax=Metabacillus sediminis TaxID=3117746 RepID=A0ABZ2NHG7_9BACI